MDAISPFQNLPEEIISSILSYLDCKILRMTSSISALFNRLSNETKINNINLNHADLSSLRLSTANINVLLNTYGKDLHYLKFNQHVIGSSLSIESCQKIHRFAVSHFTPLDQIFQKLAALPFFESIASLNLTRGITTPLELKLLVGSQNLCNLTHLNLNLCEIGFHGASFLSLACLTNLKKLQLGNNKIGQQGLLYLSQSLSSKIQTLNLENNQITNVDPLIDLTPNLTALNISFNTLKPSKKLLELTNLTEIRLGRLRLVAEDVTCLRDALFLTSLQLLDLRCNPIADQGLLELTSMQIPDLRNLNIAHTSITPQGLEAITKSQNCSKLISFNASINEIGNQGVKHIANGLFAGSLNALFLSRCQITYKGTRTLAKCPLRNITILDLSSNPLHKKGFRHITKLVHLTWLNVKECKLTAECMKLLADSQILTNLTYLKLSSNRIRDKGVEYLAKASCDRLNTFKIANNQIGPIGALHIASSHHLTNLTLLDIRNNALDVDGMKTINEAANLQGCYIKIEKAKNNILNEFEVS